MVPSWRKETCPSCPVGFDETGGKRGSGAQNEPPSPPGLLVVLPAVTGPAKGAE